MQTKEKPDVPEDIKSIIMRSMTVATFIYQNEMEHRRTHGDDGGPMYGVPLDDVVDVILWMKGGKGEPS